MVRHNWLYGYLNLPVTSQWWYPQGQCDSTWYDNIQQQAPLTVFPFFQGTKRIRYLQQRTQKYFYLPACVTLPTVIVGGGSISEISIFYLGNFELFRQTVPQQFIMTPPPPNLWLFKKCSIPPNYSAPLLLHVLSNKFLLLNLFSYRFYLYVQFRFHFRYVINVELSRIRYTRSFFFVFFFSQ